MFLFRNIYIYIYIYLKYNDKNKDIEDKIPDITNLATTDALTAVENKTPKTSDLVISTTSN